MPGLNREVSNYNQVITRVKLVNPKIPEEPSRNKYSTIATRQAEAEEQKPISFFKTSKFPRNQTVLGANTNSNTNLKRMRIKESSLSE